MAVTCQNLIEAAYARSTANDPDKLATNAELIAVIDRRMKQLYSMAARANPFYFAKSATQAYVASTTLGWPRPVDAELMIRVQNGSSEVSVVPFEDQNAEYAPRVYEFGQVYKSVGTSGDPTSSDTLTFFYAKRPADLDASLSSTHATNTITTAMPEWPTQFNDLIVLHLAKYLALKDDGRADLAALQAEEEALLDTFGRHLAHENYAVKARFGHRARMVSPGPTDFSGK